MTQLPITEPCIVGGLPMETYHGQGVCDGPSFSSSNLRTMELKSPAHCYAGWSGNPNREPENTKALSLGSAAHALILGDEAFEQRHVLSPYPDFKKKEAQEWRDAQLAAGKVIVTEKDLRHIEGMAESLSRHPVSQDGVLEGEVEQSIFWKSEHGFWLKSRMDARPLGDTLVDLKTTTDANPYACDVAIRKFAYPMQFALAAEGLLRVAGQKILAHLIVFVEKEPPYAVTPRPISDQAIWRAAQRNERAKAYIADCLKHGDWPAYPLTDAYFDPEWLEAQLTRDEEARLLPAAPDWIEQLKESA